MSARWSSSSGTTLRYNSEDLAGLVAIKRYLAARGWLGEG
jgi:hypothetical protein